MTIKDELPSPYPWESEMEHLYQAFKTRIIKDLSPPAPDDVADKDLAAAIAYAREYIADSRVNYLAPHHVATLIRAASTPPAGSYDEGYKAGKDHYCKIANHNMNGMTIESAPKSIYVDGCGTGTYTTTPDRDTIEYIRKDISTPSADTIAVPMEVLQGVREALEASRPMFPKNEFFTQASRVHTLIDKALASLDAVLAEGK